MMLADGCPSAAEQSSEALPHSSGKGPEAHLVKRLLAWGASVGRHDPATRDHCERVAGLACDLARARGFNERAMPWFRMGALLHESSNETTLEDLSLFRDIRPMVRHQHERWDGTGVPDGLAGGEIPLTARILAIADAFDSLTSRTDRGACPPDMALRIMACESGKRFDPKLFELFVTRLQRRRPERTQPRPMFAWSFGP